MSVIVEDPPGVWTLVDEDVVTPGGTLLGLNLAKSNARGEMVFEEIPASTGGGSGGDAPDASALVKGLVRLAGDLGGTASSPTVPGLADKAPLAHGHAIGDVTGLSVALTDLDNDKADVAHGHAIGDVTGLGAALAAAANVGIPTYFSASQPAPAGPLLWIKDLGNNAVSLAIVTP